MVKPSEENPKNPSKTVSIQNNAWSIYGRTIMKTHTELWILANMQHMQHWRQHETHTTRMQLSDKTKSMEPSLANIAPHPGTLAKYKLQNNSRCRVPVTTKEPRRKRKYKPSLKPITERKGNSLTTTNTHIRSSPPCMGPKMWKSNTRWTAKRTKHKQKMK